MKKMIKWVSILFGAMVVLVVLTLLIAPKFINIQKYKPLLEKTVLEKTGRTFAMDGDLQLSLFPWAGVTLKGVSLGNPEGFEGDEFVSFSEFEIRMKLLPLLSKEIEVKHIVLKGLRLVLEKNEAGDVNWEFATESNAPETVDKKSVPSEEKTGTGEASSLPIKTLAVGEISVTDGSVTYIDKQADIRKELSDVNIRFSEISLDSPIQIDISGKLDGQEFSLRGNVGPIGDTPGAGDINLNLIAKGFDIVELAISGQITDPATEPSYQLKIAVSPFSPKGLMKIIAPEIDLESSDPAVFEKFSFKADVSGDTKQVALSNGKIVLDTTTTTLEAKVAFAKPDISWNLHVDAIDIDRYLPETGEGEELADQNGNAKKKEATSAGGPAAVQTVEANQIDYTPLRNIVLDGIVAIDELRASGGVFKNVKMKTSANNGKIVLDPFSMDLYEGKLVVKSTVDVTGKKPKTAVALDAEGIEIEPLLKDFAGKDFISGTTVANITLAMTGDDPDQIKKSLGGKGDIRFEDGKIRNVNLLGMVQNLQAAFGSGGSTISNETDFSEFRSVFSIEKGVLNTNDTEISSPVLRVNVTGNADIVDETLDFRVEPTYINPKNQKESGMSISGNKVPVLISGTFSDPKFRPDLKTAAKKVMTEKLTEKLGEVLGGSSSTNGNEDTDDSGTSSTVEDSVKGLLKNLPFGK